LCTPRFKLQPPAVATVRSHQNQYAQPAAAALNSKRFHVAGYAGAGARFATGRRTVPSLGAAVGRRKRRRKRRRQRQHQRCGGGRCGGAVGAVLGAALAAATTAAAAMATSAKGAVLPHLLLHRRGAHPARTRRLPKRRRLKFRYKRQLHGPKIDGNLPPGGCPGSPLCGLSALLRRALLSARGSFFYPFLDPTPSPNEGEGARKNRWLAPTGSGEKKKKEAFVSQSKVPVRGCKILT